MNTENQTLLDKSATEFLAEYGISLMDMDDHFNSQLLTAMERYADQKAFLSVNELLTVLKKVQQAAAEESSGVMSRKLYNLRSDISLVIKNADSLLINELLNRKS